MNNELIFKATLAMIAYYKGDPSRIQHFTKVHSFARLIGCEEKLDDNAQLILELAAIMHDIGIKVCEEKYGSCPGNLQEIEGPPIAEDMLRKLGVPKDISNRVCKLISVHHTYTISDIDHKILVESDFLVNLFEGNAPKESVISAYRNIFRTMTGKNICRQMFSLDIV